MMTHLATRVYFQGKTRYIEKRKHPFWNLLPQISSGIYMSKEKLQMTQQMINFPLDYSWQL